LDVQKLSMDQAQARDLYHAYKASRAPLTANDQAIAAIYKRIAQGKLVIRALSSITAAGLNAQGLPKLAISRADMPKVQCYTARDAVTFNGADSRGNVRGYAKDKHFKVAMPGMKYDTPNRVADVPLIPVHLRPTKAIHKYHVLWEADWDQYPVDPYLLRRFGEDAWLVVAAWDLTPVERAVMSSKLNA
jgi:hypothetical protein